MTPAGGDDQFKQEVSRTVTFSPRRQRVTTRRTQRRGLCVERSGDVTHFKKKKKKKEKESQRPHASHGRPAGACRINCCLHRACRLHTLSCSHQSNYSLNFMKFLFNVLLLFPFTSLSSYSPPCSPPSLLFFLKLHHQTDKKELSLPCFQLHFLPAQEHSSISLVLSQLTSLPHLPGAKTQSGREMGRRKGGTTSRSLVGKIL